jgi:hypothetical protein
VSGRQPSDFLDVDFYEASPEGMDVFSWSPSPEGAKEPQPPTQVHLHMPIGGARIVVRFKGPGSLDLLIAALQEHRRDVWGAKP